ncbi:hypothetical protein [Lacticaseibacillus paracasei]|nr:hypothetical protein [Lacticaseibacillus paracasei]
MVSDQRGGGAYGETYQPKVHKLVCGRCINDDHGLRGFVHGTGGRPNKAGQSQYQTATSSGRIPTGARQSSRKIGKLKAAVLQLGFRGF